MVGPGALPLYPQRSTTRPGTISCLTGSAMRWNSFTFPSMRHGRLRTSGVSTGTGEPWSWVDPFLPFIFIPGMSPDICISWADSTLAEAITPAPVSTFHKKPRLLLIFFSPPMMFVYYFVTEVLLTLWLLLYGCARRIPYLPDAHSKKLFYAMA